METKLIKFGFEIEGEFSNTFSSALENVGTMKSDGSVRSCDGHTGSISLHTGEYNSDVFSNTAVGRKEAGDIITLFQEAWDSGNYHRNESAGFHIHTSYKPKLPIALFSEQFRDFFLGQMKKNFPKEFALRKGNRFCNAHIPVEEIAGHDTERYRAINFWSAFHAHGTVEFRIFPTAEPIRMGEYLSFTLACVEQFLSVPLVEKKVIAFAPPTLRTTITDFCSIESMAVEISAVLQEKERVSISNSKVERSKKEQVEINNNV